MSDPVIEKGQDGNALLASDYRPSPKPEHREFIGDGPERLTSSVISVPNEEKVEQSNDISVSNEAKPMHSHEISPSNADEVDQSNYNLPQDNVLTGPAQEKQFEHQLDEKDAMQQAHNTINVVPGVGGITPQTSTGPRRFRFLSRIPLFRNAAKSKEPEVAPLTVRQIFRYADKFDILLMFVGAIAAVAAGAFFPVMLYFYRRIMNSLADLGKEQANITPANVVTSNFGECFVVFNNSAGTETPYHAIQAIIKYYILFGFLSIFAYWLAWSTWLTAAERQVRRIRYALFRNILRQEIGWFDTHNTGELHNRLTEDLDKVKDGINDKVPDSIALVSRALGAMIYALIAGWKLALVFFSVSPVIIILFNVTVKVIMKYTAKETQAFATASAVAHEALRNIRTVTAFHGQAKEEQRFASSLAPAKQIGVKKGLYIGICQCLTQLFTFLAFAVTFWYGLQLARTECAHYTAGTVVVILTACLIATYSLAQFIPNLQNFAEALGSGSYVFNIIDRKTKIDASSDEGDKPQTVVGDIEFDNITFAYPARPETPVFNQLSFKIPSGKTVALVGPSGCGKSTLIQLIQRFYDPNQGQVLLDGKDVKSLNVAWLRSQIGVVNQDPVLFPGSIEENIRLGKADATNEEVQNAAKMANLHEFIMQLPGGYQTASGDQLSVDQRRRVAIARALISNPKILLLDEATSALDNASELVVQDALNKAKEGRTTIVIAHRLSTIQNADVIITLDKGKLIEYGPHNNLMERRGLYYGLSLAQAPKENETDGDRENDDDEVEKEFVRQKLVHRTSSKQSSIASINLDDNDGDEDADEETALTNPTMKKKTEIYVPTVFRILRLNTPEWLWILLGTANSVVYGAISPLFALFFADIYGLFAEPNLNEQKRLVRFYVVVVALIGLASGLSQFLSSVGFTQSGLGLTMRMRKLTFSAMLQQEMSYFDYPANSVGALVTRLSSDAAALKGLSGIRIGMILESLSGFIVALVIAFLASWRLTLFISIFIPVIVFAEIFQDKKNGFVDLIIGKGAYTEQGGQHAAQAIGNIRTVAALRQENYFINLYKKAFNKEFWAQMFQLQLVAIGTGVAMSIMYFLIAANFAYGSKLVERGEIKFDRVLRVFLLITFVMLPAGRAATMIPDYTKAKRAALKIIRLNKRQSRINPHDESGIILNEVVGNIEFQGIRFRYPTRPTLRILKDFSLKCASGTTTALVGPSRSGKSTVIALLQRFYDPIKGRVLLDGHDIKVLNVRWLRSLMGLVQQEPILFNLSIRENIAYGENSREVGDEEVEKAARMANIHDLIVSLPQGYGTSCGDQGNQLSNGQKQQIALARALIRSPKILLLDEVTSTVDVESEKIIQAALDDARSGRTCLASTHRLSTIQNSDKIAVIDHGKLKEEGTNDELLRYNGVYAALALAPQRSM